MPYITVANMRKLTKGQIFKKEISLVSDSKLYAKPIRFFNSYEEKELFLIRELINNPEHYYKEMYIPIPKPKDTFTYITEAKLPSYHRTKNCIWLQKKYRLEELPDSIKKLDKDLLKNFRIWYKDMEIVEAHPDNQNELFKSQIAMFKEIIQKEPVKLLDERNNSGSDYLDELTLDEIKEKIDNKLKEAGLYLRESEKVKTILIHNDNYMYSFKFNNLSDGDIPTHYNREDVSEVLSTFESQFKAPIKELLIKYFIITLNPAIEFSQQLLGDLGFKQCLSCYSKA